MQYKGEDLDLRVPHGRAPRESYAAEFEPAGSNGRWSRNPPIMTGSEPVWVDEILLACCNYAFDIAQANGAAEVALEHLVNAMTRVEAAARQLESRGVREGQLRRESAALIASEIPAANAGEAVAPRRSAELEETLRRASDLAQRRGIAAGIDDVLWVLLHSNRDHPVMLLLRRLTPDWQRSDWGRIREPIREPVSDSTPRAVQLVASDGMHGRMTSLEESFRHMQAEVAADRKLLIDLVRDLQRDVVAQRSDGASFRSDLGQRLEGLERTVHARIDSGRVPSQLADRMAQLEKAVHGGLGEGARNWAHLGQRLAQLETALDRRDSPAFDALADRIGALERSVQQSLADATRNHGLMSQRLTTFETLLGDAGGGRAAEALQSRLASIERRLDVAESETQRRQGQLAERLEGLGKLIETSRGEAAKAGSDATARLSAVEAYLADGPATPDGAVRELSERIGGLERAVRAGFGDAAATTSQIAERLATVERGVSQHPRDDGEALLILDERLGAIERMLDTRGQQALSANVEIAERLRLLEQRPASGTADAAALIAPIDQRLAAIEGSSLTRVDAVQTSLTQISSRLDQLDERIRSESLVTEEALRGRDQDFDFIYNEIKQLGQSQATLNSAVNDWRNESHEHFGTLTARLDKIAPPSVVTVAAPAAAKPVTAPFELPPAIKPTPAAAAEGVAPISDEASATSVSADDYELPEPPGRGFWYWLFGTTSVIQANRESNLEVGRMRRNIRDARERRRMQA
jgi:tetrahydromethanopterin S-methyltransferase subunit G